MQIINVEQGSPEWIEARRWVITGTRLKAVMGTPTARKTLIYELIAEMVAPPKEGYTSPAMERWHLCEELVKEKYPEIQNVGLIKKDGCDWLGISCDGIHMVDGKVKRAIEVKSPEAKNFVKYAIEGGIPDEYFWQVIHYFIIIDELESLDFIVYNPEILDPKLRQIVTIVKREEKWVQEAITQAKEKIASFRLEWTEAMKKIIAISS